MTGRYRAHWPGSLVEIVPVQCVSTLHTTGGVSSIITEDTNFKAHCKDLFDSGSDTFELSV